MAAVAAIILKKKRDAEAAAKAAEEAESSTHEGLQELPVATDESENVCRTVDEDGQASDDSVLHELYLRVTDSLESKAHYRNLAAFFVFVAMYMGVLYCQMDAAHTYQVASAHKALLPPDSFQFGGGVADIYSWLNDTIINTIYKDAECGDGVCSAPEEYPGFGTFGCQADCGSLTRVTNITIFFSPFVDDMSLSTWNLCMTSPVQFCWFTENQTFGPQLTSVSKRFRVPDGSWQVVINAPSGGVSGHVALDSTTTAAANESVASLYADVVEEESFLATWGGCAAQNESSLAACRTTWSWIETCSWFAVCAVMACANVVRRDMANTAYDCYQTCDVNAGLILNKFQNVPCLQVAEGINNQSSFVAIFKDITTCTLDPEYDGRTPANGLRGLVFTPDGRLAKVNTTGYRRRILSEGSQSNAHAHAMHGARHFDGRESLAAFHADPSLDAASTSTSYPSNAGARAVGRSTEEEEGGAGAGAGAGAGCGAKRRKLASRDVTLTNSDGSSKAVASSPLPPPPPSPPPAASQQVAEWPAPPAALWASLGSTDGQRLDNLGTAMARALFTLVKDPCAARHPINPYKNATRLVAFMCAYLGGPATLPGCSYTDASTGVALTEPLDLARAMQAFHKRFKAGQDEEEAWVGVLQSSIASVVALPADAVLGLSNYLRLLDQVLVTGGPSACKQPAISLPWGRGSRHSTTIAAGDTVQWVWADDEVHSIADQKVGNSSLAGYMGMGSGNLTLPRSRTCSSANTEGLSIEQLPPAPCALAYSEDVFSYTWRFDTPGVYYYQDGTASPTAYGVITVLPAGQLASVRNEEDSWEAPTPDLWRSLGPSNSSRLQALQVAVSRALFTWPKEACTARFPIDPYKAAARFSTFFCAYLGGPPTLPGCNFTDRATGRQLTDPFELARAMQVAHASFGLGQDEETAFVQIFLDSLYSVVTLPGDISLKLRNYLSLLDAVIVTGGNNVCDTVDVTLPWRTGLKHNTTITAGDTVQWGWADDDVHSIRELKITNGPYAEYQGVGSGRLMVSRSTRCNSLNSGGQNITELPPVPCAVTPTEVQGADLQFSFTWTFDTPGTYYYECGRVATQAVGQITVLPRVASDVVEGRPLVEQVECAPGCPLWHLRNGLCKADCNVDACAFDGGDCSCSNLDTGITCTCWPGQVRDPSGACCEAATLGDNQIYPFEINNYYNSDSDVYVLFEPNSNYTKRRSFALKNRLLIGVLLHQTRLENANCSASRFKAIYPTCSSHATSTAPFGVDPVFLSSSDLYNPGLSPLDFYTKEQLSAKDVPFGFFHEPMEGYEDGFPLIFDTNLDNKGAIDRLQYLIDGFYFDNGTRSLLVQITTFNGDRQEFANMEVKCTFQRGGKLGIQWSINAVRVQLYHTSGDIVRAVFEVLVLVGIVYNIGAELQEAFQLWRKTGRARAYCEDPWNVVDLLSLTFLLGCAILWFDHLVKDMIPFNIHARYDVYDLGASARFWQLADGGEGFRSAAEKFGKVHRLIRIRQLYKAFNGVNIFLLMLRVLKVLDFQPRMGIITRTLSAAAPELLHFGLLMGIIFVTYSLMAHLVFGHIVDSYRTFAIALSTNFDLILGNSDVSQDLLILPGWELWAGQIFYWTFMVFLVFILMNFLIAIVVDAFTEAKATAEGAPTLPAEVLGYVNDWVRSKLHSTVSDTSLLQQLLAWDARKLTTLAEAAKKEKAAMERVLKLGPEGPSAVEVDSETLLAILERASRRHVVCQEKGPVGEVEPQRVTDVVLQRFGEVAEPKLEGEAQDLPARKRRPKKLTAEELRMTLMLMQLSLARIESSSGAWDNATERDVARLFPHMGLKENRCPSNPGHKS